MLGFQTGDIIFALVPSGKKKGSYCILLADKDYISKNAEEFRETGGCAMGIVNASTSSFALNGI